MKKEIWKDIQGYEGLYKVSNLGNFKRLHKVIINKAGQQMTFKEKILSNEGFDKDGYVLRVLNKNKRPRTFKAHRLVAQAFIPNPDNLPQVNHKNGIKNDNRVENLEWTDASGNVKHSIDKLNRKILKGEEVGNSVLTEKLLKTIIKDRKERGLTYTELQNIYNINRSTIHAAIKYYWKHIEKENFEK